MTNELNKTQAILEWCYKQLPELKFECSFCNGNSAQLEDGLSPHCGECDENGYEYKDISLHYLLKAAPQLSFTNGGLVILGDNEYYPQCNLCLPPVLDMQPIKWSFSKEDNLAVQLEDNPALVDLLYSLTQ